VKKENLSPYRKTDAVITIGSGETSENPPRKRHATDFNACFTSLGCIIPTIRRQGIQQSYFGDGLQPANAVACWSRSHGLA